MARELVQLYHRLADAFGPQHWWPADSPLEVMVGAILVQNTSWRNVERAIANLHSADVLDIDSLVRLDRSELESLIRPAGTYRVKATRLRNLLQWIMHEFGGDVGAMIETDLPALRNKLLAVPGVGPETADSILLYAAGKPSFVVDRYTYRILARHAWIDARAGYAEIQRLFTSALPVDVELYNEYHALLVRVGHLYCRRTPRCDTCPLADLLPESGPLAVQ